MRLSGYRLALAAIALVIAGESVGRPAGDFEIAAFIDAEAPIRSISEVEIISSSCKKHAYGFAYEIVFVENDRSHTIRSKSYDRNSENCDGRFPGYFQPFLFHMLYFDLGLEKFLPVADTRKYFLRSFLSNRVDRVMFLGNYVFPPGLEVFLISIDEHDLEELKMDARLSCSEPQSLGAKILFDLSASHCASDFFENVLHIRWRGYSAFIGNPRALPLGF